MKYQVMTSLLSATGLFTCQSWIKRPCWISGRHGLMKSVEAQMAIDVSPEAYYAEMSLSNCMTV